MVKKAPKKKNQKGTPKKRKKANPRKSAAESPPDRELPKIVPVRMNTLQAVVGYLGKHPYEEVAQILDALRAEISQAVDAELEDDEDEKE